MCNKTEYATWYAKLSIQPKAKHDTRKFFLELGYEVHEL